MQFAESSLGIAIFQVNQCQLIAGIGEFGISLDRIFQFNNSGLIILIFNVIKSAMIMLVSGAARIRAAVQKSDENQSDQCGQVGMFHGV